jgi:ankyrin repeat protein
MGKMEQFLDACYEGDEKTVRVEINKPGFKINAADENGETALHFAVSGGHLAIVRILLDAGVSVNQADAYGYTALYMACQAGFADSVELLLEHGGDVYLKPISSGKTCLHIAAQNIHKKIVDILLDHNSTTQFVNNLDKKGVTALMYAASNDMTGDIVATLLEYGADPNMNNNVNKETALHRACMNGNLEAVRQLMKSPHIHMDAKDAEGRTPMMLAEGNSGAREIADLLSKSVSELKKSRSKNTRSKWTTTLKVREKEQTQEQYEKAMVLWSKQYKRPKSGYDAKKKRTSLFQVSFAPSQFDTYPGLYRREQRPHAPIDCGIQSLVALRLRNIHAGHELGCRISMVGSNTKGVGVLDERVAEYLSELFRDKHRVVISPPKNYSRRCRKSESGKSRRKQLCFRPDTYLKKNLEPGYATLFFFDWGENMGHIITAYKTLKGELYYFDPQQYMGTTRISSTFAGIAGGGREHVNVIWFFQSVPLSSSRSAEYIGEESPKAAENDLFRFPETAESDGSSVFRISPSTSLSSTIPH